MTVPRDVIELKRVDPRLRPLVADALALLALSHHPWADRLARVLRSRWIRIADLPGRWSGFTFTLLPVIWLDEAAVKDALCRASYCPITRTGAPEAQARHRLLHTLLHEAAHQLGAVWPEWRNWIGDRACYGPDRNAADAIAESVLREVLPGRTRYAGQEISYKSPLERLSGRGKTIKPAS